METENINENSDNAEHTKKCFCARCFLPIDAEDRVEIEGQHFHKSCCTCCICRTVPTSLKMFYGHVFCAECFKTHVLNRFKGESPMVYSNNWWMQWGADAKPEKTDSEKEKEKEEPKTPEGTSEEPCKKCFCARCLQPVDESNKIEISGQSFHPHCCRCYYCQKVPLNNVKIYYGQVFCEECFTRHVLSRNKDNPNEFFRHCFEQWQNNTSFAQSMKEMMTGNKAGEGNVPNVCVQSFCRCGRAPPQDWCPSELKKSATPATPSYVDDLSLATWDLSFENRTEGSDVMESCNESANDPAAAAEKIEKLTKYLHKPDPEKSHKKWKNFVECDKSYVSSNSDLTKIGWVDLQDPKIVSEVVCPNCLWQCGSIFVDGDYFKNVAYCGVDTP